MDDRLKHGLNKLINKHFSAVQTDTDLGHDGSWSLEKKAKQFWDNYHEEEAAFKALLERCVIND